MALAEDFRAAIRSLPSDWEDARFSIRFGSEESAARAAGSLGFLGPGRHRETVRFYTSRRGAGHGPDFVLGALRRLDSERLHGELELVASDEPSQPDVAPSQRRATLAGAWDAELAAVPPDWSDMYAELELRSTDDLERAALLLSPVNPSRFGGTPGFRFRAARTFGYGAAPEVVRSCFERLDESNIRGEVRVLRVLSDSRPVGTQGPVWYVGGRAV